MRVQGTTLCVHQNEAVSQCDRPQRGTVWDVVWKGSPPHPLNEQGAVQYDLTIIVSHQSDTFCVHPHSWGVSNQWLYCEISLHSSEGLRRERMDKRPYTVHGCISSNTSRAPAAPCPPLGGGTRLADEALPSETKRGPTRRRHPCSRSRSQGLRRLMCRR